MLQWQTQFTTISSQLIPVRFTPTIQKHCSFKTRNAQAATLDSLTLTVKEKLGLVEMQYNSVHSSTKTFL